jgi:hypothetical protein
MSVSSNDFELKSAAITAMSYLEGSFVITEGEAGTPPPTFKHDGQTWKITIGADRKNSKSVADSFNVKTGGAFHAFTNSSGDTQPKELNFYFGVNATFDIAGQKVTMPIYLGQGHFTFNNNWWMGANSLINQNSNPIFNVISGGVILQSFSVSGDGNYKMTLTPVG